MRVPNLQIGDPPALAWELGQQHIERAQSLDNALCVIQAIDTDNKFAAGESRFNTGGLAVGVGRARHGNKIIDIDPDRIGLGKGSSGHRRDACRPRMSSHRFQAQDSW